MGNNNNDNNKIYCIFNKPQKKEAKKPQRQLQKCYFVKNPYVENILYVPQWKKKHKNKSSQQKKCHELLSIIFSFAFFYGWFTELFSKLLTKPTNIYKFYKIVADFDR